MNGPKSASASEIRDRSLAMKLSLFVGVLMLIGKLTAYHLTGSAAILSDAAESVIHVIAVAFAAFSLWLSQKPARANSPYGYERITFFSAGFEGGMIFIAAIWIIAAVVDKWRAGLQFEQLGLGTLLTFAASAVNLVLGLYLVRTGQRTQSLILIANGKHVLTDSWTSFGVVAGLGLVLATGWKPFDPLIAIAVALNIIWSAFVLIRTSIRGLLDLPDPERAARLAVVVEGVARELGLDYHRLRFRDTGQHVIVSLHLLFPQATPIGQAHETATAFEERIAEKLDFDVEVESHLESIEDHPVRHPEEAQGWAER